MDLPSDYSPTSASDSSSEDSAADLDVVFASLLSMEQDGAQGCELLDHAITGPLRQRIGAVSSFGAESVLLLSIIAGIDPSVPVIFLDTGKHFPETLAYRRDLAAHLGLTDVRDSSPREHAVRDRDPTGELWHYDQDACCDLRKVGPLERALAPFDAWISGRKRFQAATRAALPFVERDGGRLKLNPLADWDAGRIEQEMIRRDLPRHPLVERGYPSIGCAVCTRSVSEGEDSRAGRWSSSHKVECGIHSLVLPESIAA